VFYAFFSFLRAVIIAVGLTVLLNTCFYVLFLFYLYLLYCLCSQINDDDDSCCHCALQRKVPNRLSGFVKAYILGYKATRVMLGLSRIWVVYAVRTLNHPTFSSRDIITEMTTAIVTAWILTQEAQLPQRNSASAAHVNGRGTRPSSPLSLLWLHLCVWSNPKATTYVRQACRP